MRLSQDFSLAEFRCRDGADVPDNLVPAAERLAEQLQVLRNWYARPVVVTSGYRTPAHNRAVGGAPESYHLGRTDPPILAADIQIPGVGVEAVAEVLEGLIRIGAVEEGGIGVYPRASDTERGRGWVHYDPRGERARWGE